ncbi:MAG: hypothetical protein QNJ37_16550 [Crocosphaera sp.]|nr:hypothetical protein [Crocosphaera sp.]
MDTKEVFQLIDNLVFRQTGKHLDTLQLGILKNVFNGQKYAKIAEDYNCSEGHARDKAYELWRILSDVLGEELNKSNIRAAIERFIIANNINNLVNSEKIDNVNFCSKPSKNSEIDDFETVETENSLIKEKLIEAKLETVPRLIQLGLTTEQIAQALDLELELILDYLKK